MNKIIFSAFLFISLISTTYAKGLYIKPRAGATVPVRGADTSFSIGGTVGYQINSLFGIESSYTRLLSYNNNNGQEGDTLRLAGTLSVPLGIIRPFGSLGVGAIRTEAFNNNDWNTMVTMGGGLQLAKILFVSLSIGADYAIVSGGGRDFVEPYLSAGIQF